MKFLNKKNALTISIAVILLLIGWYMLKNIVFVAIIGITGFIAIKLWQKYKNKSIETLKS